ncbi:von Willebrand factor-like [Ostrinia nubilalis]|uniref:von Willebrand factor-like n=1 Tax=Ostrinia nubilalis TaxID=29057 RepID=UPI0030822B72
MDFKYNIEEDSSLSIHSTKRLIPIPASLPGIRVAMPADYVVVNLDAAGLALNTKRLIPIPASLPGIRVAMPADYVVVNLDAAGLALKWDTNMDFKYNIKDGSVSFRSTKRLIPIPASLPGIRVAMPADYVVVNLDAAGLALNTKRLIPVPASLPGIRVAMPADYVVVNLDAAGLALKWDTNYNIEDGSVSIRSTKRLIPIPASLPGIRVAMPADYVVVNLDAAGLALNTKRLIPIPASLQGIHVAMPADYVVVNLDAAGLALKWDTNDIILVEGSVLLWNNTEGLCGTLNSNPEDDLVTREGTRAKTKAAMASSWQLNKIGDICEGSPSDAAHCAAQPDDAKKKAQQFCARIFSKDKFRKCSKVMDVTLLLEACQEDYCACKDSQDPEECACSTVSVFAKECLRHGVEEMKFWRDPDTCPKTCPDGKIYKVCGPDSQPSCSFPQVASKADNATCIEGCFCPEGLLLEGGKCVQKEDCPCRLRNRSFKPGSVIPKECNSCTCQAGEWKCTQVPCGARCSAVGDPHYTTFDGQRYDFMGHCTYTLLQTNNITVEVENVACSGAITEEMNLTPYKGEGRPSCTKAVNLKYDGANIHLKQGGLILVNGKEVSALPVNVGQIRIRAASSLFVIVQLPLKVDIWWDGNTRVFVDVPPSFQGKTKGLCGTFNLKQSDDFLTPEGDVEQSTLAFANKWKTREFCEDLSTKEPEHPCKANVQNKEMAEKYCSKLKSKLFEECHWFVDVEAHYEACLYDMCACAGDAARCLCPLLGDYAMACAKSGVLLQWRYNVQECGEWRPLQDDTCACCARCSRLRHGLRQERRAAAVALQRAGVR